MLHELFQKNIKLTKLTTISKQLYNYKKKKSYLTEAGRASCAVVWRPGAAAGRAGGCGGGGGSGGAGRAGRARAAAAAWRWRRTKEEAAGGQQRAGVLFQYLGAVICGVELGAVICGVELGAMICGAEHLFFMPHTMTRQKSRWARSGSSTS